MKIKFRRMQKKSLIAGVFITAAITSLSISNLAFAQTTANIQGIAAVVNDDAVTSFDVAQRTRLILLYAGVKQADEQTIAQATQQALNSLINEKLQLQEAKKFKLSLSDDELKAIMAKQAQANGAKLDEIIAQLKEANISPKTYIDKSRADILWQRLIAGRYGSKVKITKEQIDDTINRISASANQPQYQVAEIYLEANSNVTDEQAANGAKNILQQIKQGASFAKIARQFSSAPSAASGGNMGWVGINDLKPQVAEVINIMPVGAVSEPIKVQGGYMIVGLLNKRTGKATKVTYDLKDLYKPLDANASDNQWKAASTELNLAKRELSSCNSVEAVAKKYKSQSNNFSKVDIDDLNDDFKSHIMNLNKNQTSDVFRTADGVHLIYTCNKEVTGADIPSREQVEDNLTNQELTLISNRYLRNLRRDAAIVIRKYK